jgi:hypothetical protein
MGLRSAARTAVPFLRHPFAAASLGERLTREVAYVSRDSFGIFNFASMNCW